MSVDKNEVPALPDANKRTLRTALAVVISTVLLIAMLLPEILNILLEEMGEVLPPHIRLWLVGFALATTAFATAITRIMAIPIVNSLLSRFTPFGTQPEIETPNEDVA